MNSKIIICAAAVMVLASCSKNEGWKVQGTVKGATEKDTLYLEESVADNWHLVEAIALKDGKFEYASEQATAIPSIYRLRLGKSYIYFPVDSIETVEVTANKAGFDRGYTLAGNKAAAGFVSADSLVADFVDKGGNFDDPAFGAMKRQLGMLVNSDSTALVSYYIVGKVIGDRPVYSLTDKADLRVLGNAVNNYSRIRPNDPRFGMLKSRWENARKALGIYGNPVSMNATVSGRPNVEIKYYDANGKEQDFDKFVGQGNVTILNLTRYDGEGSQANTVALNEVYEKYKGNGLKIYQIGYDPDEHAWRRSAVNMPWTTVWAPLTDNNKVLSLYMADPVNGAPVSFVFNGDGDVIARVEKPADLDAAVAKAVK